MAKIPSFLSPMDDRVGTQRNLSWGPLFANKVKASVLAYTEESNLLLKGYECNANYSILHFTIMNLGQKRNSPFKGKIWGNSANL